MNTEQLKTAEGRLEEIVKEKQGDLSGVYWKTTVLDFASQESNRAVDEFKEKLKKEILRVSDSLYTSADHFKLSDHLNNLIDKL